MQESEAARRLISNLIYVGSDRRFFSLAASRFYWRRAVTAHASFCEKQWRWICITIFRTRSLRNRARSKTSYKFVARRSYRQGHNAFRSDQASGPTDRFFSASYLRGDRRLSKGLRGTFSNRFCYRARETGFPGWGRHVGYLHHRSQFGSSGHRY